MSIKKKEQQHDAHISEAETNESLTSDGVMHSQRDYSVGLGPANGVKADVSQQVLDRLTLNLAQMFIVHA